MVGVGVPTLLFAASLFAVVLPIVYPKDRAKRAKEDEGLLPALEPASDGRVHLGDQSD